MNIFEWIKNKKELEKELEKLDRDLDLEKAKNSKLKNAVEELKVVEEQKDNYLETIKEQRKEIKKLKKENKFLIERENKLQQIEQMCNGKILLKELTNLIKGK